MADHPALPRADLVALGHAVRRRRSDRRLSRQQLAELAGVSIRTIGNLESGSHDTSVSNVIDVARALRIQPAALIDEIELTWTDEVPRLPSEGT